MSDIQQAAKTTNPKAYVLKSLKLIPSTGSNQSIDISYMLVELSIYEDLHATTMSGEAQVSDANDLLHNLPILGFEYIEIVLGKPNTSDTLTKTFRVYKIDSMDIRHETVDSSGYTIKFCSEEEILNTYTKVSKSYKGKLISDIVRDMLTNQLKVNSKKIANIDSTTGIHDYIIPYIKPFEAINWLLVRSQPMCLFFENTKGFNFTTIDKLAGANSKATYLFGYPNYSATEYSEKSTDLNPLLQVIRYEFLKGYDMMSAITQGTFGSRLITIDPITNDHDSILLDYDTQFGSVKHIETKNPSKFHNQAKDRFSKTINQHADALVRLHATTKSQTNPNQVEQWLLQKAMRMSEMNHFKLKMVVPGNIQITVGDIITFTIPTNDGAKKNNLYHSGRYLISAIRHKINFSHYEMIIEGTRDCVSAPYPSASDTSAQGSA